MWHIDNHYPTQAKGRLDPDFLPRCARKVRVCAFHQGKALGLYQRHKPLQEIGASGAPSICYKWLLRHDNDPLLNRNPGSFCPIADLQLGRDLFDVIADSELTYLQNSAYILVGQPF
jgi:hypothetical protein